jgi:hypothetical protein
MNNQAAAIRPGGRKPVGSWLVMPLLILLFAGIYLALFSPVIAWMLGGGTQGTFVAQSLDCHHGCAWFGRFTSINGKITLQDVRFANLNDLPDIQKGTTVPVADVSSVLYHGVAYPRSLTARDFLSPAVLVAALLGLLPVILLVLWIWTVPLRYWRYRAAGRTT